MDFKIEQSSATYLHSEKNLQLERKFSKIRQIRIENNNYYTDLKGEKCFRLSTANPLQSRCYFRVLILLLQACRPRGPPDFGRSVNPYVSQPGGVPYAHHITTGTTGISDLPTALYYTSKESYIWARLGKYPTRKVLAVGVFFMLYKDLIIFRVYVYVFQVQF